MKTRKMITTAPSVSQVRGYRAFMASKQIHSWCGIGSHPPIHFTGPNGRSEIIDKPRGKEAAVNEAGEGPHFKHCEARSPP